MSYIDEVIGLVEQLTDENKTLRKRMAHKKMRVFCICRNCANEGILGAWMIEDRDIAVHVGDHYEPGDFRKDDNGAWQCVCGENKCKCGKVCLPF